MTALFLVSFVVGAFGDDCVVGVECLPPEEVGQVLGDLDSVRRAALGAEELDCLEEKVIDACSGQSHLDLVCEGALHGVSLAESEDELVRAKFFLVWQELDDESFAVLYPGLLQGFGRVSVDPPEEPALVPLAQP